MKEGDIVYVRCRVCRVEPNPQAYQIEVQPFAKNGEDEAVAKPWWYSHPAWLVTPEQLRKGAKRAR